MKFSEAKQGRTFVIRLEDGDVIHEEIEKFAAAKNIQAAALIILGGVDQGSALIVGPKEGRAESITPMKRVLDNVHEVAGTGTLFPNEQGVPVLHMHIACGRENKTTTGCVRAGVKTWHILEVIMTEYTDSTACRKMDATTGFELLVP